MQIVAYLEAFLSSEGIPTIFQRHPFDKFHVQECLPVVHCPSIDLRDRNTRNFAPYQPQTLAFGYRDIGTVLDEELLIRKGYWGRIAGIAVVPARIRCSDFLWGRQGDSGGVVGEELCIVEDLVGGRWNRVLRHTVRCIGWGSISAALLESEWFFVLTGLCRLRLSVVRRWKQRPGCEC